MLGNTNSCDSSLRARGPVCTALVAGPEKRKTRDQPPPGGRWGWHGVVGEGCTRATLSVTVYLSAVCYRSLRGFSLRVMTAVHDGFATIRAIRCRPREPPPPRLEPLVEETGCVPMRLRQDLPWWELATRKYRTRSCSHIQVHPSKRILCLKILH